MTAATVEAIDPDALELESEWVWYAHFPCGSTNYGNSYVPIGTFSTIGDFWRHVHAFPSIETMHAGLVRCQGMQVVAYSIFRQNVKPEWEDSTNIEGSEWGCRESLEVDRFSNLWINYIMGAVGETIPHCVGIRAINKSNRQRHLHKIEVWMDCIDTPSVQECRRSLTVLVPSSPRFTHMPHQDKQVQAIEYQRQRRRKHGSSAQRYTEEESVYAYE